MSIFHSDFHSDTDIMTLKAHIQAMNADAPVIEFDGYHIQLNKTILGTFEQTTGQSYADVLAQLLAETGSAEAVLDLGEELYQEHTVVTDSKFERMLSGTVNVLMTDIAGMLLGGKQVPERLVPALREYMCS